MMSQFNFELFKRKEDGGSVRPVLLFRQVSSAYELACGSSRNNKNTYLYEDFAFPPKLNFVIILIVAKITKILLTCFPSYSSLIPSSVEITRQGSHKFF